MRGFIAGTHEGRGSFAERSEFIVDADSARAAAELYVEQHWEELGKPQRIPIRVHNDADGFTVWIVNVEPVPEATARSITDPRAFARV